jgi:hypothetical protein
MFKKDDKVRVSEMVFRTNHKAGGPFPDFSRIGVVTEDEYVDRSMKVVRVRWPGRKAVARCDPDALELVERNGSQN